MLISRHFTWGRRGTRLLRFSIFHSRFSCQSQIQSCSLCDPLASDIWFILGGRLFTGNCMSCLPHLMLHRPTGHFSKCVRHLTTKPTILVFLIHTKNLYAPDRYIYFFSDVTLYVEQWGSSFVAAHFKFVLRWCWEWGKDITKTDRWSYQTYSRMTVRYAAQVLRIDGSESRFVVRGR